MAPERLRQHPSPPYSIPLEEIAPPEADGVRVRFPCPHCGEILERVAKLDETRWYIPTCGFNHGGVGVVDQSVERVRWRPR